MTLLQDCLLKGVQKAELDLNLEAHANTLTRLDGDGDEKAAASSTRRSPNPWRFVVILPPRGVAAFDGAPAAKRMPTLPVWPSLIDEMRENQPTFTVGNAWEPDFVLKGHGSVERRGQAWEITFDVGDLRPGEGYQTRQVTVVVGNHAPERIPMKLLARATNRTGSKVGSVEREDEAENGRQHLECFVGYLDGRRFDRIWLTSALPSGRGRTGRRVAPQM
jgi:hypothetical protein